MTELKNTRLALAVLLGNLVKSYWTSEDAAKTLAAIELISDAEKTIWDIEQGRLVA